VTARVRAGGKSALGEKRTKESFTKEQFLNVTPNDPGTRQNIEKPA